MNKNEKRDFIHVFDVCDAIMSCFKYRPEDKTPMDIGTGESISILKLKTMFPWRINHFEFQPGRNVGADSSIADISLAKKLIKFEPRRKLEYYIKEMIS